MNQQFPMNHFFREDTAQPLSDSIIVEEVSNSNGLEKLDFTKDEISQLSQEILLSLKDKVGAPKFETFFEDVFELKSLQRDTLIFMVTTPYIKRAIESQFFPVIESSAQEVLGKIFKIVIETASSAQPSASPSKQEDLPKSVSQVSFNLDLNPTPDDMQNQVVSKYLDHLDKDSPSIIDRKKTFNNFIVGPSNNMAHASMVAVSQAPGKIYPSVYIHANSGLGKTHLLHAVSNAINDKEPQLKIKLITARDFISEFINSIKDRTVDKFHATYTEKTDVLIIDDIHELKNKPGIQNSFFHIFNDLHANGKQLIFTSDKPPKEIDGLEERIKTRLSWGLVLDIQQPDLETRIAILKRKAMEEDIYLPDDVVNLIASAIRDNIRELESSLIRLGAYSSVFKVDIDVEIAKQELKLDQYTLPKQMTMDGIGKTVSQHFKIPMADLKSKSRLKEVANARHIAMYLSYKVLNSTLVEIGQFYGKRDHTTVMHAIDKIKKKVKEDNALSLVVLDIENKL